ncbi:MAG: hypothetical protein Q8R02_15560 [Hyphomonadaceae bacterium]|nr:hypothetical protein [Hyphomonadaceae bacterium]
MDFTGLLTALKETPFAIALREGDTLFPWTESIHVLSITVVVGMISIVDLRLLGVIAHKKEIRSLMGQVLPLTWGAFVVALISGFLMFSTNPFGYVENWPFLIKIGLLAVAGANVAAFHLITSRKLHLWDEGQPTPPTAKLAGATSLGLWIAIVVFGRFIGFTL